MTTPRIPGPRAIPALLVIATIASVAWLQSMTPASAAGPPPTHVSVGSSSACAVLSDGTVRCWGDNSHGQLGNGTATTTPSPSPMTTTTVPQSTTSTTTSTTSTTASTPPTKANPTANRYMAVPVTGLTNIKQVGVGAAHACALSSVGRVTCWGDNSHGQVGRTPFPGSNVFAPLDITPSGVVAAGLSVGLNHSCLWTTGDRLYCWGEGSKGQLGVGSNPLFVSSPALVSTSPGVGIVSVGTGEATTCIQFRSAFIDISVNLFKLFSYSCTGSNSSGEFASGNYVSTSRLTAVAKLSSTPRTIAGGYMHSCRLDPSTGLATCAGRNWEGQLGNGTNNPSILMVSVPGTYSRLTTGSVHTCGYDTALSQYRCWGQDFQGQLGDGQTTNANSPRTVTGLKVAAAAASIDAGHLSTCAIVDDGPLVRRVYCWGSNELGQLGNATIGGISATPVLVRGV